jgi:putative FmdB family regulatory protein
MALPVYEYKCESGHLYERTEGFDAPSEQQCLECGAAATRQLSVPAVIFKGSGFYSTDNRKGYASPSDNGGATGGAGGNGKSDSKSDSGSESTSDSGASKTEASAAE